MTTPRSYSSTILAFCGIIVIGIGLYFVFLRPPLLPEDVRFTGLSASDIQSSLPGLSTWLRWVFTVMGGFIVSSGLFTVYFAITSFRMRARGAGWIVSLSGLASIGSMSLVNLFVIHSDFQWILLGLALIWGSAVILYLRKR